MKKHSRIIFLVLLVSLFSTTPIDAQPVEQQQKNIFIQIKEKTFRNNRDFSSDPDTDGRIVIIDENISGFEFLHQTLGRSDIPHKFVKKSTMENSDERIAKTLLLSLYHRLTGYIPVQPERSIAAVETRYLKGGSFLRVIYVIFRPKIGFMKQIILKQNSEGVIVDILEENSSNFIDIAKLAINSC